MTISLQPAHPTVEVHNLSIETAAGVSIVEPLSMTLRPREITALVGESDCGKTAVALALLGHARLGTRIASGAVTVHGTDILQLAGADLQAVRGAKVSYVPQDPSSALNPRLTIGSQMLEAMTIHGFSRDAALKQIRTLLDEVQLPSHDEFLSRHPFELSGGQQQRILIATAVACLPSLVVLDEPTTALDVTTQEFILTIIRRLADSHDVAFLHVTHDLAVVDQVADHVAVMYAGRLIETGPKLSVFRDPQHPYTSLLLGCVPPVSERRTLMRIDGTAARPGERPSGCSFRTRCPMATDQCAQQPGLAMAHGDGYVACHHAGEFVPVLTSVQELEMRGETAEPILSVTDLRASYGRKRRRTEVVHGVSFDIQPGECLALVGESGSGKSTTGRCLAGLHVPDGGTVLFDGQPLAERASARNRSQLQSIQTIFQNPDRSLNPSHTIGTLLERPLKRYGDAARGVRRAEVVELLDRVGLSSAVLRRMPGELSGGEKQRVAIARALAARPSLLICDEVTSALDVSVQATVLQVLDQLRREGLAMLFITHNLGVVRSIADRALVMEQGMIVEQGLTADILDRPQAPYTQRLVHAAPELLNTKVS
jgi:peptide/nickel transport system ATP-binding protein